MHHWDCPKTIIGSRSRTEHADEKTEDKARNAYLRRAHLGWTCHEGEEPGLLSVRLTRSAVATMTVTVYSPGPRKPSGTSRALGGQMRGGYYWGFSGRTALSGGRCWFKPKTRWWLRLVGAAASVARQTCAVELPWIFFIYRLCLVV
jgi:hypothetical protein